MVFFRSLLFLLFNTVFFPSSTNQTNRNMTLFSSLILVTFSKDLSSTSHTQLETVQILGSVHHLSISAHLGSFLTACIFENSSGTASSFHFSGFGAVVIARNSFSDFLLSCAWLLPWCQGGGDGSHSGKLHGRVRKFTYRFGTVLYKKDESTSTARTLLTLSFLLL